VAVLFLVTAGCAATDAPQATSPSAAMYRPVIDMHMHAMGAAEQGPPPVAMCAPIAEMPTWDQRTDYLETFKQPPCPSPIWSPETDEALMRQTLAAVERNNVFGVLSGPPDRVAAWRAAAPGRFLAGLNFNLQPAYSVERLRELHADGRLDALAEVAVQYQGVEPGDPRLEPFWALAEELDIPVGIHMGPGPPGVIYMGARDYRARLHSPLLIEEVLVRHPRLRVYIMHAGFPMTDDILALLYAHPQVHVETGVIVYTQPREAFYGYIRRIVEAGFGKRIMFGSDHMVWPETIERSIAVIRDAPFLTEAQKEDILYNNAARFLRLTPEQMAGHKAAVR
jgi:hypothetical protein